MRRGMVHRAVRSPAHNLVRPLCYFPIDQQTPAVDCQKNVPDTYIPVQDLCHIKRMPVSFVFAGQWYSVVNSLA